MARMDHSRCDHPATPEARAACRKAGGPASIDYVGEHLRATIAANTIKAKMDREYDARDAAPRALINEWHCSQCGSTDPENTDTAQDPDLQGYSACCNEPVVDGQDCPTCTHD